MGNLMYFGNFEEGKMRGFQSFEGGNHPFTPHPLGQYLGRLGEKKNVNSIDIIYSCAYGGNINNTK